MIRIGQVKTLGSNNPNAGLLPFLSRDGYPCANIQITKGLTAAPPTLMNCFERFPKIKKIADDIGFNFSTIWTGPGTGGFDLSKGSTYPTDIILENPSDECIEVAKTMGSDWLGCLWGSPEASFSCICPEYGTKFEAYVKLRQNVATFWNTRTDTPVKRQEFLDSLQFGPKVEITVPGDFDFQLGSVVYLNATAVNKMSYVSTDTKSKLNDKYWIAGIKHVLTNSGTHESRLLLTRFGKDSAY